MKIEVGALLVSLFAMLTSSLKLYTACKALSGKHIGNYSVGEDLAAPEPEALVGICRV